MTLDPINSMYYLEFDKSQIEKNDISQIQLFANKIFDNPTQYKGSVDFYISGYVDDPRELYEIPEVCAFIKNLNEKFPFWFYFLTTAGQGLKILRNCQIVKEKINIHQFRQDDDKVVEFFELNFHGMNHICMKLRYTEAQIEELTNEIFAYYNMSPLRPVNESFSDSPGSPII